MGGAFVAVADDASAVYWNPAGLALGGSYFSMVLDNNQGKAEPEDVGQAGSARQASSRSRRCPWASYYRITASNPDPHDRTPDRSAGPAHDSPCGCDARAVATEHVAVGATLKWVHGYAATGLVPTGDRDDLLDGAGELPDASTSKFDADIGVMAMIGHRPRGTHRPKHHGARFFDANSES